MCRWEADSLFPPLTPDLRRRFDLLPVDPAPVDLIRQLHYYAGNERSAHLWHQSVAGRGGALLGVGSDLNYTLAGWARSELMVVIDFDQAVVDLHRCYLALLEACDSPAGFVEAWSTPARERTTELLRQRWDDDPRRHEIVRTFRMAQPLVIRRLHAVRRDLHRHALTTFMDDAADYQHVRGLVRTGRVVVTRGDYGGEATVLAVAAALRGAGQRLGVIYLSNVEQYLDYTPQFRRNFSALGLDAASLVLRTLGKQNMGHPPGERYHYNMQSAETFVDWLRDESVTKLAELLRFRTATVETGLSTLGPRPAAALP